MRNQHTPGPWIAKISKGGISVWGSDNYAIFSRAFNTHKDDKQVMADAALIAAAPELLEALEELLESPDLKTNDLEQGTINAMHLAIKAIAKAKGE